MYTLNFAATIDDTIVHDTSQCNNEYTNIRLLSISSSPGNNSIQTISNIDVTQFVCDLKHVYKANIPNNLAVARTYSFNQLNSMGLFGNKTAYISGPSLDCSESLVWLLYSVNDKYPVKTINTLNLPPYATREGYAFVEFIPVLVNTGADAYFELHFPASPDGNNHITYSSTNNNSVFATRVNAATCTWNYANEDSNNNTKSIHAIYMNIDLVFEAIVV